MTSDKVNNDKIFDELTGPATLNDIAERSGYARVTVWRALNNERKKMSPETFDCINAVARELNYDPSLHQAARNLVNRKTGKKIINQVIALMLPKQVHVEYFHRIFQGILESLVQHDYGMLSYHSNFTEKPLPITIRRGDVDGIIIYESSNLYTKILDNLRVEHQFGDKPVVFLMKKVDGCSSVITDDFAGGYAACAHLLDLGHRHILWHSIDHPAHHLRKKGYIKACIDRNLNPDECLIAVEWQLFAQNHHELQYEMLIKHPEITGILLPNDGDAIITYHKLHEMGKRVPEEISIIGYDDTDKLTDKRGKNILTTVRLPLDKVGEKAAEIIIDHINGDSPDMRTEITLPVELKVRKTTSKAPGVK
jgi:LacI family transcriptional regulator